MTENKTGVVGPKPGIYIARHDGFSEKKHDRRDEAMECIRGHQESSGVSE